MSTRHLRAATDLLPVGGAVLCACLALALGCGGLAGERTGSDATPAAARDSGRDGAGADAMASPVDAGGPGARRSADAATRDTAAGPGTDAGSCPLDAGAWTSTYVASAGVQEPNSMWGSAANDVWIVGGEFLSFGTITHYDGTTWSSSPYPGDDLTTSNVQPYAVWGSGASDVWVVGALIDHAGLASPLILHWDGSPWSPVANPDAADGGDASVAPDCYLASIWGSGAKDVWAVGACVAAPWSSPILHWDGTAWSSAPSVAGVRLSGVWGSGAGDVWAVGTSTTSAGVQEEVIFHYDGVSWSKAFSYAPPAPVVKSEYGVAKILSSVWGSGPNDVWSVGSACTYWGDYAGYGSTNGVDCYESILHFDGTSWTASPSRPGALSGVWGRNACDVWAVGQGPINPRVLHWDCTRWSDVTPPTVTSTLPRGGLSTVWGTQECDVFIACGYQVFSHP